MEIQYSFENFIMQCCKAKEWELRKFLKRLLKRAGFRIEEDNFKSHRGGPYSVINNFLAVRGENPRVCLVAHTDVCRDHAFGAPDVDPVIKVESIRGALKAIIQDKDCNFQVGGDDRLGVAINTWIALNTGYDMALLFTTDEEIGLVSAEYVDFKKLIDFDILLQVDRGNHSNQLVTSISGCRLCSPETAKRLLKIAEDIDLPRNQVNGMMTDVLAIKMNGMCKDAVNMTCGYHNSYGAEKDEYIDIQEAKDTMKYVSSIIQYYYLDEDKFETIEKEEEIIFQDHDAKPTINTDDDSSISFSSRSLRAKRKQLKKSRFLELSEKDLWNDEDYNKDKNISPYFDDTGGRSSRYDY